MWTTRDVAHSTTMFTFHLTYKVFVRNYASSRIELTLCWKQWMIICTIVAVTPAWTILQEQTRVHAVEYLTLVLRNLIPYKIRSKFRPSSSQTKECQMTPRIRKDSNPRRS
uniref:Uncharacterized protein n=1 Tax=Cacopsylla melanoneura TaxID=428564 RepID=A0A8D8SGT4_9HEMI